jgi:hypothetical protein
VLATHHFAAVRALSALSMASRACTIADLIALFTQDRVLSPLVPKGKKLVQLATSRFGGDVDTLVELGRATMCAEIQTA